jgi:hypothetical protein
MLFSPPALAVLVSLAHSACETVPRLEVEPSCRAAARVGDHLDASMRTCMNDESTAHSELQSTWTQFPMPDRQRCVALSSQGAASYVALLECLTIAREAKKIEKAR